MNSRHPPGRRMEVLRYRAGGAQEGGGRGGGKITDFFKKLFEVKRQWAGNIK